MTHYVLIRYTISNGAFCDIMYCFLVLGFREATVSAPAWWSLLFHIYGLIKFNIYGTPLNYGVMFD